MSGLEDKVTRLCALLREFSSVVVCFSGGVDSSFLLAEAVDVLGDEAVALTAMSPSLAPAEGAAARQLAAQLGARHVLVETYELDDPRYAANPVNRCYFCKTEVYGKAVEEAARLQRAYVLDGFNVDDRADYRPGRQAAREQGVRSPLDEVGFTKLKSARRRAGDLFRFGTSQRLPACRVGSVRNGRNTRAPHAGSSVRTGTPRTRFLSMPGPLLRQDRASRGRPRGDPATGESEDPGAGGRALPAKRLRWRRGRSARVSAWVAQRGHPRSRNPTPHLR